MARQPMCPSPHLWTCSVRRMSGRGSTHQVSKCSQRNTINHRVNGSMFGVTVGEKSKPHLRTTDVNTTTTPNYSQMVTTTAHSSSMFSWLRMCPLIALASVLCHLVRSCSRFDLPLLFSITSAHLVFVSSPPLRRPLVFSSRPDPFSSTSRFWAQVVSHRRVWRTSHLGVTVIVLVLPFLLLSVWSNASKHCCTTDDQPAMGTRCWRSASGQEGFVHDLIRSQKGFTKNARLCAPVALSVRTVSRHGSLPHESSIYGCFVLLPSPIISTFLLFLRPSALLIFLFSCHHCLPSERLHLFSLTSLRLPSLPPLLRLLPQHASVFQTSSVLFVWCQPTSFKIKLRQFRFCCCTIIVRDTTTIFHCQPIFSAICDIHPSPILCLTFLSLHVTASSIMTDSECCVQISKRGFCPCSLAVTKHHRNLHGNATSIIIKTPNDPKNFEKQRDCFSGT